MDLPLAVKDEIVDVLRTRQEPLSVTELTEMFSLPRHQMLARLRELAVEGRIQGKQLKVGAKGIWVWWAIAPHHNGETSLEEFISTMKGCINKHQRRIDPLKVKEIWGPRL